MLWTNGFTEYPIRHKHAGERDRHPHDDHRAERQDMAEYSEPAHNWPPVRKVYASAKFRVTDGSTGMPGPVVVDIVTFFR